MPRSRPRSRQLVSVPEGTYLRADRVPRTWNPPRRGPRRAPLDHSPGAERLGPTLVAFGSLSAISSTFDSLFKVLFIFPSRYLFAIGLPPVFSFGWNLPPTLSCNPKQLDSWRAGLPPRTPRHRRGCHPPWRPLPRDLSRELGRPRLCRLQFAREGDSQLELFPLHSPLLGESSL